MSDPHDMILKFLLFIMISNISHFHRILHFINFIYTIATSDIYSIPTMQLGLLVSLSHKLVNCAGMHTEKFSRGGEIGST